MPIVHMCSSPSEVPEGAVNVRDVSAQWKHHSSDPNFKVILYDTHVGLCLFESEYNGYDDSDFYMTVWNPQENRPEKIEFASTRGWSYPCLASRRDAPPEIQAKYDEYQRQWTAKMKAEREALQARIPARGKQLKVVAGRKLPLGTQGECTWTGKNKFDHSRWGRSDVERVGLKTPDGQVHWLAAKNVEVVL